MSNMGKGAGYYLTRSKSLLIDTAIVAILAIFMSFAMQMDALQSKGEDYLVLMLYAVIFGLTSLQSGAMIVDLTAKDKLSRRVEFFAASGIAVKEIIKQYSIQIFRFSGIIPFFVFMSCYYFTDWTMSFGRIVCVYLSILVLSFCEIVALNIIVLDVKRVKLFKNVLFFGNFALVYLIAMSAERITEFVNQHHIGIDYLIIVVDVALCMMFALLSFFKARHMSNSHQEGWRMGLITLNLKRVLNWNFIFMSAVAAIFGMIFLMNFGDISENIVFGVDIKYFMLDGYLCLFIFFAGEISKDMLQQEKITKRIEWKLANGIKISSIVKENLLSLWIGTLILLFPLLLMISIRLPNLILLLSTYFLILSILYSAFINVLILWIRNMNWFKSIPIFATLLHILLVVLKCGIFMKTNNVWVLLLFSPVSIIVLTACGLCLMTKERIVSSYY